MPSVQAVGDGVPYRTCPGKKGRGRMQIRLTVLGSRSGRSCDVLVTAPSGTTLGTVAAALAGSVGSGQPVRSSGSAVVLYAGAARLDMGAVLGVPPLVDGAVLALHAPDGHGHRRTPPASGPARHPRPGHAARRRRSGRGRGAPAAGRPGADRPLRRGRRAARRPGRVPAALRGGRGRRRRGTVADLGSTNGTRSDGRPVARTRCRWARGALLRIGESTLRLEAGPPPGRPAPRGDRPGGQPTATSGSARAPARASARPAAPPTGCPRRGWPPAATRPPPAGRTEHARPASDHRRRLRPRSCAAPRGGRGQRRTATR